MKALEILQEGLEFMIKTIKVNPNSVKELQSEIDIYNEVIKELEERQKEDEYIYQKMKESLSRGNKAQSLSFVEVYQIINKRLSK